MAVAAEILFTLPYCSAEDAPSTRLLGNICPIRVPTLCFSRFSVAPGLRARLDRRAYVTTDMLRVAGVKERRTASSDWAGGARIGRGSGAQLVPSSFFKSLH